MSQLISSSAEAIEGNDDLLTQIFVRVPLIDVLTFERVSKRWLSLISAPYFSRCRATVQRTRVSGLILDPYISAPYREKTFFYFDNETSSSFDPTIPDRCSNILQSCNGLMLLYRSNNILIYNPTTGAKKPLPLDSLDFSYSLGWALAFDPLRFLGYKLIYIFHGNSSKEDGCQTMIYSSESGAWKHCGSSFSAPTDMEFTRGVYFKDSVYWIGNKSKTTLRFDLKEERVKDDLPPLPPKPQDLNGGGPNYLTLAKFFKSKDYNGYEYILAPACGYMNLVGFDFEFCMRVFRLEEDDSSSRSWVLIHNVDIRRPSLETAFDNLKLHNMWRCSILLLHLTEDGEDDEMALLLQIYGEVVAVRLKNNTVSDVLGLKIKGNNPGVTRWSRAFEYVESLACL